MTRPPRVLLAEIKKDYPESYRHFLHRYAEAVRAIEDGLVSSFDDDTMVKDDELWALRADIERLLRGP